MKLIFGSDHAAFSLRKALAHLMVAAGHDVVEVGAPSEDSYDYPDASDLVAEAVLSGTAERGVLLCGSGIGVSIRANRYPGIRAALCTTPQLAELARAHNQANVLCMGARVLSQSEAEAILAAFLTAEPEENPRHERRIAKLDAPLKC